MGCSMRSSASGKVPSQWQPPLCARIDGGLQGLGRLHMNLAHHVAQHVGPDRDGGGTERPEPVADLAQVRSVSPCLQEQHLPLWSFQGKPSPEGATLVENATARSVPGRHADHLQPRFHRPGLPHNPSRGPDGTPHRKPVHRLPGVRRPGTWPSLAKRRSVGRWRWS